MKKAVVYTLLILFVTRLYAQNIDASKSHYASATYYHDRFEGRRTSNGERFSQKKYTAAHRNYKFGTLLLVTDTTTDKWVIVRVNDRCPKRGVLDLSRIAAKQLGILRKGTSRVKVQPLPDEYYEVWEKQATIFNGAEASELPYFTDIIDVLNANVEDFEPKIEATPKPKQETGKQLSKKAEPAKKKDSENVTNTKSKKKFAIKETNKAKVYYQKDTTNSYKPMVFE